MKNDNFDGGEKEEGGRSRRQRCQKRMRRLLKPGKKKSSPSGRETWIPAKVQFTSYAERGRGGAGAWLAEKSGGGSSGNGAIVQKSGGEGSLEGGKKETGSAALHQRSIGVKYIGMEKDQYAFKGGKGWGRNRMPGRERKKGTYKLCCKGDANFVSID